MLKIFKKFMNSLSAQDMTVLYLCTIILVLTNAQDRADLYGNLIVMTIPFLAFSISRLFSILYWNRD